MHSLMFGNRLFSASVQAIYAYYCNIVDLGGDFFFSKNVGKNTCILRARIFLYLVFGQTEEESDPNHVVKHILYYFILPVLYVVRPLSLFSFANSLHN
jgi:hypothetical protein